MLTNVFGLSIKYAAWSHQDDLPLYIAGSYDFYTPSISDKNFFISSAISTLRNCLVLAVIN